MNTISQAYVNALLADATYVNLVQGMSEADLKRDLEVRMTPTQAAYIAANFEVASSINSSDIALFGSGFDATVWRGRAGGEFAGQVFVSARGTEPEAGGADLLADGDLALQVGARSQIIDMVNWWLRESTPIDQQARQIKWDTLRQPDPLSLQIVPGFVDAAPVAGTGGAVGISSVQINGHSLGGHMASAFARIFGGNTGQTSSVNVQAISTFNSAGFNGNNAEAIFQSIQSLLGSGTSSFESVSAKQTNYFAQNGINVTTNTWWFTQMGKRTALFQEESTGLSNHSMYKLTDLLALGAALEKLDSTMNLDRLNNLLKAGSNQPVASLEGLLDSLRKMTQGSRAATTPVGDGEGSAPSRQDFHINLKALTDSPIFVALAGKVTLSLPDSTLATKAKTDFAAFLSLNALSPVVISTSDAASITALKAANPALSIAWTADKNARLYGDTTKAFDYTDNWYEDRTALLQNLTIANTKDALANPDGYLAVQGTPSGDTNTRYIDLATSKLLQVNNARISPSTAFNKYVMFGDDTANTMNGGSQADSLYGGAGDDTLDGKAGADYLEGGTGDDKLDGGKDSDILNGGTGTDTYTLRASDSGVDTIVDSDGLGSIKVIAADTSETTLGTGAIKKVAGTNNKWESEDKRFTYTTRGGINWVETGADAAVHYQLSSCLRPYLLVKTPTRCPNTAQKASPDVQASCRRIRSRTKFTPNSIAACARKKGARGRFDTKKRSRNTLRRQTLIAAMPIPTTTETGSTS